MRPPEFPSILHDSRSHWIVLNSYLVKQLSIIYLVLISGILSWVSEKDKKFLKNSKPGLPADLLITRRT